MTAITETRYAVQWKYHGNWVTYGRDYESEKDALRDLKRQKDDERADWTKLDWRAVEIATTTRRIDGGDR